MTELQIPPSNMASPIKAFGFLVLLCCTATVSAHICLLNPHQRGSMSGINKPAADDCILTTGPCGGRDMDSYLVLKRESNYTVIFQKNLDHYTQATPGYFSISFSSDEGQTFEEAMKIPDMGEPSLHLYIQEVTLPKLAKGKPHNIMQVVYKTNNPAAPPAFYQCTDIILY
ncbi:uncharacterized protein [Watersipora subatra]|uniref:uncharacterized protein isoform X2 n=1 Tax=Watersipora subatra TaxID=2589382 RepID=UPI00355BD217